MLRLAVLQRLILIFAQINLHRVINWQYRVSLGMLLQLLIRVSVLALRIAIQNMNCTLLHGGGLLVKQLVVLVLCVVYAVRRGI